MDVTAILDQLNEAQREAVSSPLGHALVLAGAGSGKTRVLTQRIAWLSEVEGLSPFSIMAVTFTNKAAAEMRHRIEAQLNMPLRGMWVGTFHGLAHRFLRAHWQDANLDQNFQILDADDQLRMVRRVMVSLDIDEKKWPPRQSVWWINAQKDDGLRAAHIHDQGDVFVQVQLRVYRAYEEACERGGLVDFAELLLRMHETLLNRPELLAHYQRRFKAILVDEFQDTNALQYAWLRVLAGNSSHVMVVGDDDQSIYGWRGAKIENIQRFERDFKATSVFRLEQNYRSTANILQAANGLIEKNADRLGKSLWTADAEGERIGLYAAYNEIDESRFIVARIQDSFNGGEALSEHAILYRSNAQSRVLEEGLLRAQIPYRIYGGQRFFERAEIRTALAYLRLLSSRDSDAAFERVVNVPPRGIGDKSIGLLRDFAREKQLSLWQAATELCANDALPGRAQRAVAAFLSTIDTLDESTDQFDLPSLVETVIDAMGLKSHYEKEGGERGQARLENLSELVSAARSFDPDDQVMFEEDSEIEISILDAFLAHAALEAGDAQGDRTQDAVQMMTMHSAKGLEFKTVFLAGMEDGLFPHQMSMDEPGRLEEERRLCYVGITRARQKLYLTYAESRRLNGSDHYNRPSRFISDIPRELVEEIRAHEVLVRPALSTSRPPKVRFKTEVEGTQLKLGQKVNHAKFGEGVILAYEGTGPQARVQVAFDGQGIKWLMAAMAKLEPKE
jgi:DNA helicase-2/ATP-dependent DNA helicase PcrA